MDRKTHPATVRLDAPTWQRVERLAQEERRPISQLLRNIISDAVDGQPDGKAAA